MCGACVNVDAARGEHLVRGGNVGDAQVEDRFLRRAAFLAQHEPRAAAVEERQRAEGVEVRQAQHLAIPLFGRLRCRPPSARSGRSARVSSSCSMFFLPASAPSLRRAKPRPQLAPVAQVQLRQRVGHVKFHRIRRSRRAAARFRRWSCRAARHGPCAIRWRQQVRMSEAVRAGVSSLVSWAILVSGRPIFPTRATQATDELRTAHSETATFARTSRPWATVARHNEGVSSGPGTRKRTAHDDGDPDAPMTLRGAGVAVALSALALAACGGGGGGSSPSPPHRTLRPRRRSFHRR